MSMSRPRLRPHFDLYVAAPPSEVTPWLQRRFDEGGETWAGHIAGDHAQLVVRRKKRHPWSPWLTFAIEPREAGTLLRGRFAPHPGGWTAYLACYGIVVITTLGLGFFGVSQWIAEETPHMLWSFPGGLLVLGLLYLSAFVGQRFSASEMEGMRAFITGPLPWAHEWLPPQPAPEASAPPEDFSPRSAVPREAPPG
jgi:hypothetical protein